MKRKTIVIACRAVSFAVGIEPALADPVHFDAVDFGPAPVAYATSASGSAPLVAISNPVIGDDYEVRSPVLLIEANAAEQRDK